jgi:hypothetical protein
MLGRRSVNRTIRLRRLGFCGAAVVVLASTQARAADKPAGKDKTGCTAAYATYKGALEREKAGHLREAREMVLSCADSAACPALAPKCRAKYAQLGSDMPSIVPVVTDESGAPRVDVEVRIDGTVLTSKLDGKGLPVDPGLHELAFSADGRVFDTEKVMVVDGQRNRPISVAMGGKGRPAAKRAAPAVDVPPAPLPASDPGPSTTSKTPDTSPADPVAASTETTGAPRATTGGFALPRSPVPYVVAGVGLAGIAAGALLTYWGKKDNDSLLAECGQTQACQQSSVDHIRTMYVAADISIGAGVVALGVATWLFATSHGPEDKPAARSAYVVDVHPTSTGAVASVAGSF